MAVKLTTGDAAVLGARAPAFTLPGPSFTNHSLASLNDGRRVVLVFFPAAFGAGEAGSHHFLREVNEEYEYWTSRHVAVVAIGKELPFTMAALSKRLGLKFPVLSDVSLEVSAAYVGTFDLGAHLDRQRISHGLAGYESCNHGVVIIDTNGSVMFKWAAVTDSRAIPAEQPDVDAVRRVLGL